jgi:hypothetical protein
MSDTDEKIVMGFLNNFPVSGQEAGQAFERILARTLPELPAVPNLPDHFYWSKVGLDAESRIWTAEITELSNPPVQYLGFGPTIRAACEAALAKIGEKA